MIWLKSMDNILVFIWWITLFILIFPLLMLTFYIIVLWIKRTERIPGYFIKTYYETGPVFEIKYKILVEE